METVFDVCPLCVCVCPSRHLTLSQGDMGALTGGKGFPFLFQHIRDGINIRQTCNLIFSLCRYNNRLAEHVGPSRRTQLVLVLVSLTNVSFSSFVDRVDALHLHR